MHNTRTKCQTGRNEIMLHYIAYCKKITDLDDKDRECS